jgi:splicing factor U2AF subunit
MESVGLEEEPKSKGSSSSNGRDEKRRKRSRSRERRRSRSKSKDRKRSRSGSPSALKSIRQCTNGIMTWGHFRSRERRRSRDKDRDREKEKKHKENGKRSRRRKPSLYWDVPPPGFEHVTPMQYKAMQAAGQVRDSLDVAPMAPESRNPLISDSSNPGAGNTPGGGPRGGVHHHAPSPPPLHRQHSVRRGRR